MKQFVWSIVLAGCLAMPLMADDEIRLPAPQKSGGMTLLEALSQRKTTHRVQGAEPSLQQIANVLWAANGITRPDGKRTAPSAMNRQEIEIAVLTAQGLYEWDEEENELERVETTVDLSDQLRGASMLLIFTYDDEDQSPEYAQVDCGFVGQNVYLYCASAGLGSRARGGWDQQKVIETLGLKESMIVVLGQTVGYCE